MLSPPISTTERCISRGGGRGEDQRRQSFEGDGVDNAFGERLALMWGLLHGELPPVLA